MAYDLPGSPHPDERNPSPDGGHTPSWPKGYGTEGAFRLRADLEGGLDPTGDKLANLLDDVTVGRPLQTPPNRGSSLLPPIASTRQKLADEPVHPPDDPPQPSAAVPPAPVEGQISIRGRTDGVAIELGEGPWRELVVQLDDRLEGAANFFRGGGVALDLGDRSLSELELSQVCEVIEKYGLTLGIVRTTAERTFQSALTLGLAARLETPDPAQRSEAGPAESNSDTHSHFVYRGNLRSGQVLQKRHSILVIGDVNPGGHVISAGDILIWGRLRGVAHAGADGSRSAIVAALQLEPTQLRIANLIAIAPPVEPDAARGARRSSLPPPEIAYIVEDRVLVAPWTEARRGGWSVLMR